MRVRRIPAIARHRTATYDRRTSTHEELQTIKGVAQRFRPIRVWLAHEADCAPSQLKPDVGSQDNNRSRTNDLTGDQPVDGHVCFLCNARWGVPRAAIAQGRTGSIMSVGSSVSLARSALGNGLPRAHRRIPVWAKCRSCHRRLTVMHVRRNRRADDNPDLCAPPRSSSEGGRPVRQSHDRHQSTLADRLHLPQDHRSLRSVDDHLRIAAQLVAARSSTWTWAERNQRCDDGYHFRSELHGKLM